MKNILKFILAAAILLLLAYFFIIFLPGAFAGSIVPNPIIFSIGKLSVRWYGFLIAIGVAIAYYLSEKDLVKSGINESKAEMIPFWIILFGLIGARLGFVVQNIRFYSQNILEILKVYDGGLSIHGAITVGIITFFIISRKYKITFLKIANAISPQLFLAGAIGRFGNFFNQEIIGKPTNVIWKMFIAPYNRPLGFENNNFFHPVFLYESLLFLIFYALYFILRKKIGSQFGFAYTMIFYSLTRIIVEFWRIDYKPILGPFDLAQLVSFGIIIIGLVVVSLTLTPRKK